MKAIIRLRFLFLCLALCTFVACNESGNVASGTEYGTETNLNPAPNLAESKDRNNPIDKGAALMATLAADALGAWQGGLLGTAVSVPLGPLAPVGGVVGGIVCGGGASYATGCALGGGGNSGGGTTGGNQGGGNPGGGNQGGNNGNSGSDGGYTGPGAPAGGGGRGGGPGRKPVIVADVPYDGDYVISNLDYVGYLHNALLIHLDANMPAFDTVDVTVLTNMYNLSKNFMLSCGYFTASDVNSCFISLDSYVSAVGPYFDVRDLDDVISIIEQINTSDVNQNIIRNSMIDALSEARNLSPEYLYSSNYFQTMETNIVGSLNLFQPIGGGIGNDSNTTTMSYGHLILPVAKYSYALWYKYMYLQDE